MRTCITGINERGFFDGLPVELELNLSLKFTWIKISFQMYLKLIFVIVTNSLLIIASNEFKIGGVFHRKEDNDQKSLEELIFEIAANGTSEDDNDIVLITEAEATNQFNSILVKQSACNLLEKRVIALFGPQLRVSSPIVKAISDTKEIPNIQTRYDAHQRRGLCGVNLYPHPKTLAQAYAAVIKKWEWNSFMIVYEDNESLIRINSLLKWEGSADANVKIMQLPDNGNYIPLFQEIRRSDETNILLDCSTDTLPKVLQHAQQSGVMIKDYSYIITCLDLHTIDLEPYKYSGVNITGFRLINPSKPSVNSTLETIISQLPKDMNITVEAALLHDAVKLYKTTLQRFKAKERTENNLFVNTLTDVDVPQCYDKKSWKFGTSLVNDMRVTEINGLSGLVKFDNEGFRTSVEMQIIELSEEGIIERGIWNSDLSDGVKTNVIPDPHPPHKGNDLSNTTLNIVISLTKPYGMRKNSANKLEGNDRYEGYAVDLIRELSLLNGFKYNLIIQEDGANGQLINCPNKTKACWDGMVGKVYHGEADLALADVTMSRERQSYIDFSTPYMDLGISILYMKPKTETPSLFSFLFPFSTTVWLLVVTAYIGVSLQFFVMARLTPYEWRNPYPCIQEPEELENQFTLSNSLWFTIGALMQQGSDIAPISPSTRIAAGVWWFFTLIMVSSYTANLAAFLTVENEVPAFKDAKELSKQTKISYGAKRDGTTANFFRDSRIPEYQAIYDFMTKNPHCMTTNNEEGVNKVVEGKGSYAFFMESSAIDYEKEQHCELAQIGPLLDNKNYGIAMRKNSWYANDINTGVLLLQEKGKLSTLKRKWWKEKYSKNCQVEEKHDAQKLYLNNVGGVFLVLIAGVAIAFIAMIFELYFHLKNSASEHDIPVKHQFLKEIRFIMQCKSVKPTLRSGEMSLISKSDAANSASMSRHNYGFKSQS